MQAWNIPFYNTTISDLLEDLPAQKCDMCNMLFSGVCMAKWYYITVCMWFVRCSHSWDIQHSKEYFVFQRALLFSSLQIWKLGEQDFS